MRMRSLIPSNHRLMASMAACATGLLTALTLTAASTTWTGGGANDNWSTGGNWSLGTAPGTNDLLNFAGSTRLTPNNNLTGAIINNLAFSSNASSFTVGGNAIVLTNGRSIGGGAIAGGSISNQSANAQTISLPITVSAGHHYIVTPTNSGALNLSGTFTRATGSTVTFNKYVGNINTTGTSLANVNSILGGWATYSATTNAVTPTNWAALDGSGNVIGLPGAGFTAITAGTAIASAAASNVKITTQGTANTLNDPALTDINTLMWAAAGVGAAQTLNIDAGQTLRLGAKGGIMTINPALGGTARVFNVGQTAGQGTLTAGGADNTPGELFFIDVPINAAGGNNLSIRPVITDNGTGPVTVHILGYVEFNGTVVNTYSGGTYINQGRVQAGGLNCFGTGPVYVFNGGHILLNANGTWTNDFYIAGLGTPESSGIGALRLNGGGRNITGTVTLMDTAATGNGQISGRIRGTGNLIVGSGIANGSGTLTVGSTAGPNDYTGDTIINNSNPNASGNNTLTIAAGLTNVMPHGVGKGNLILNGAATTATFNLNGTDEIINGLTSTGTTAARTVNATAGDPTLTLGDNDASGDFAGVLQNNGANSFNVVKIGTGTQTLTGANTYNGLTTISGGKLVLSTTSTGGNGCTVADNTTLGVRVTSAGTSLAVSNLVFGTAGTTTLDVDTSTLGNPTAPAVTAVSGLALNGNVAVNISGSALTAGTFTVLTNASAVRSGSGSFVLGAFPPRASGVSLNDDVANNRVTITIGAIDSSIKWNGGVSGNWNINQAGNTIWAGLPSGTPTYYLESAGGNDVVVFNDTATGTTNVNITTNVSPLQLTVTNDSKNYVFSGTGKIGGTTALNKSGTGSLTLRGTGGDNFTGGISVGGGSLVLSNQNVNIAGGVIVSNGATVLLDHSGTIAGALNVGNGTTVQVGNNDANGAPPTGTLTVDGSLIFSRSDSALALSTAITGAGSVTVNNGLAGMVTSSGVNTYTGPTVVNSGTLALAGPNAANSGLYLSSGLTINNGGTVQLVVDNSLSGNAAANALPVTVNAGGVLTGTAGRSSHIRASIVLNGGELAMGGTQPQGNQNNNGAWDLDGGVTVGNPPSPTTSIISSLFVIPNQAGGTIFDVSSGGTPSGNDLLVTGSLHNGTAIHDTGVIKNNNGTMALSGTNTYVAATTINSGTFKVIGAGLLGSGTYAGNINNESTFIYNSSASQTLSGSIVSGSGNGLVIQNGPGQLTLSGANSYPSNTAVNAGTLLVNGSLSAGATVAAPGTLGGTGTIGGNVIVTGTLAPGLPTAVGTLTCSSDVIITGTNLFKLDKTNATADLLAVSGTLTMGGTLKLATLSGPLAGGDTFHILNATTYNGSFTSISPAIPGPGLTWDTNSLTTTGFISVVGSGVNATPTNIVSSVAGGNLTMTWPGDHIGWTLQVQTNSRTVGLNTNWFPVAGSTTTNQVTVPVNAANPTVFYRLSLP